MGQDRTDPAGRHRGGQKVRARPMSGASPFGHVETWIFDLDNTLYPPSARLFDQINHRMTAHIAAVLGVAPAEADHLRTLYWRNHGATLTGLIAEHGIDPDHFLADCHAIDLAALAPCARLAGAIERLPGRKIIHTNGPRMHAERVLESLALSAHFEAIITIEDTQYRPKPNRDAYRAVIDLTGLEASTAAMIEDQSDNLKEPARLGMTTVLVSEDIAAPAPGHVDHHVTDLAALLDRAAG